MNHHRSVIKAVAVLCVAFLAFSTLCAAAPDKKEKQVGRLLYGKVLDQQDNPLADAVVYVTNTRPLPGLFSPENRYPIIAAQSRGCNFSVPSRVQDNSEVCVWRAP